MRLNDQQKINAINEYKINTKISASFLAKKYSISISAMCCLLKRRGIIPKNRPIRKYSVNENYFDKIDSEEKAYFLGFLYADGYVHEKRGCVTISLRYNDKEILVKLNKLISSNRPLAKINYNKYKRGTKNQFRLNINSKKIAIKLKKIGCSQNKSFTLKFPNKEILNNFERAFIRGYFDGDGSFGRYKEKLNNRTRASFSIMSTNKFNIKLKTIVESELGINTYIYKRKKKKYSKYISSLKSSGDVNTIKFLDWIYKDSSIALRRKYMAYLELKKELENKCL